MLSAYIIDLIDHKERVAKYMEIAARSMGEPPRPDTLMYALWWASNISPLDIGSRFSGQLLSVASNTWTYFRNSENWLKWGYATIVVHDLFHRASVHDNSKFSLEEFEIYEATFSELQKYAYGTPEYKAAVAKLGPAWKHHYQVNDHHPEHSKNGIAGMHAIQQIEMCCDWLAASERSQKDIFEGLEINRKKYNIDDQLFPVLKNTIVALKEGA